jgi:hypothetical protein
MASSPTVQRAVCTALLLLSVSLGEGRAAAACPAEIERWAAACAQSSGLAVSLAGCPAGAIVVHVPDGSEGPLAVEISAASPERLRTVGALSLAPIGEFADWEREPPARRGALDAVVECVRVATPPLDLSRAREPHAGQAYRAAAGPAPLPWLLLGLAGVAFALLATHRRALRARTAAPLAALALSTLVVRALVLPSAFFHQNGQGPGWIDAAFRQRTTGYGAGFNELFAALCRLAPAAPERPVFLAQAIAAATIPLLGFALARAAFASRTLAGSFAVALAIDPLSARLAQSESYYLTIEWLLFCAAALAAYGTRQGAKRSELALCLLGAGLAIAEAARVHPIGWIPAAVVPLVGLFTSADARRAVRQTAIAAAAIAVVVAATTGPAMLRTLRGQLGEHWIPVAGATFGRDLRTPVLCAVAAIALGLLAARRTARAPLYGSLALLGLLAATAIGTNLVGAATRAVNAAYGYLFAPLVLFALARLVAFARGRCGRSSERWLALSVACAAGTYAVLSARSVCTLPTDAREIAWAIEWRRALPADAAVYWVGHAQQRVVDLPLYDGARMPQPMPLAPGGGLDDGSGSSGAPPRGKAYYYRSSLCSTPDGREACDAFERSHGLTLVERRTLPAIASLPSLPFTQPTVDVALYRIATAH